MPRLPSGLLWKAKSIDPLLLHLVPVCRDLTSARNELRWLSEHVWALEGKRAYNRTLIDERVLLHQLCERRGRGEPLQYILGSEYFGDLEIQCQPGVLIPRQETATSVTYLVRLLRKRAKESFTKSPGTNSKIVPLRVLDLCCGTGCMSLLLIHELLKHRALPNQTFVRGVDISISAVNLATLNKERVFSNVKKPSLEQTTLDMNTVSGHGESKASSYRPYLDIDFMEADIFCDRFIKDVVKSQAGLMSDSQDIGCNILVANPPYISPAEFGRTTARSVRNFEPKLALVPPSTTNLDTHPGDTFYPRILEIAQAARPMCMLLEVADMDQATRIACMVDKMNCHWSELEIWRDDPFYGETCKLPGTNWITRGRGNGRSVFVHNFTTSSPDDARD